MIQRHIKAHILSLLDHYPAVALLGPRQAGKTTLARTLSDIYFDLELETEQLKIDIQWDSVAQSDRLVLLDEAQTYPAIFPRLRHAIDENRQRNGRFLILGSVSPGLMKQVSEFLTGRIAICELSPLSLLELEDQHQDRLWLGGGFPDSGILANGQFPVWQNNYLGLLAMRDLPAWGFPATPTVTKRFFKMLAAANGGQWNASQIGKSMGLSYHTVNSYLNFLEQTYLIRLLPPYFTNIKKRLVKSPKIYWRDTGLLHALMGCGSFSDLLVQPWVGTSWENFVIEQILICLTTHAVDHEPFYFRTSTGDEIDLLIHIRSKLWVFEIKLSTSPDKRDLDKLTKTARLIDADRCVLVSQTNEEIDGGSTISTNLRGILERLKNQ
jgi:predicted AAA+ superfamily ATPase